jgi:DNA-binding NarL/FixJ family response regulator
MPTQPSAVDTPRLRCVVADDHPAIVDAVRAFLASTPEIDLVGTAATGADAYRLVVERSPDVAVLDIRMPEPTGVEITRRLSDEGSKTGVILFTGYPDRGLLLDALDAGARAFLLKESPLADLVRAMKVVASGGTYVDPMLTSVLIGAGTAERLRDLSKRERDVLRLLADGMRNEQVAATLGISPLTVQTYIRHAMEKLEADTRTQAVASALRHALIE